MLALENIANRLLVVPRPARVSALRAELTSLNHKLPAEVRIRHQLHNKSSLRISERSVYHCGVLVMTLYGTTKSIRSLIIESFAFRLEKASS